MSDQKTTTIRVRGLAVEWPCDDLFDELARVRTAKDALEARVAELEAALQVILRIRGRDTASSVGSLIGLKDEVTQVARAALATEKKGEKP